MKKTIFISAMLALIFTPMKAQNLHYQMSSGHNHFLAAKFGADYGTVIGLSYGQRITSAKPTFLTVESSIPFGHKLLDDWKMRLAVESELWKTRHFSFTLKPGFIVRRYDTDIARLLNIGADLTTSFGYFNAKWLFAIEANYDQSLSTHIKHHSLQENYPDIYNGWIGPAGANLKFGAQAGYAFGKNFLSIKAGKVYARSFQDNPTLPFYFEITCLRLW